MPFDREGYLRRIRYDGPVTPSAETLRELHRAHLLHVPFENLDIGWKRHIVCEQESFVRKVLRGRGGFCYELNGSFAALLDDLGFKLTLLSARVPRTDGSESPEFDHLTLRVDLEEPWLADVGFGDSFLEPLRLQPGVEQREGERSYRITESEEGLRLQMRVGEGPWRDEYRFTLRPRALSDFAGMCEFHQTSPKSHFTRNSICSIARPWGRVTLTGDKLIVMRDGQRSETPVTNAEEWSRLLLEKFGITGENGMGRTENGE